MLLLLGWNVLALVDAGAQVSTASEGLYKEKRHKVKSLNDIIRHEVMGGITVPYKGYVEVYLQLLVVKQDIEGILLLVMSDSNYSETYLYKLLPLYWKRGVTNLG